MKYLPSLCLLFLTGCAAIGLSPAQGLDQKLAYAEGVDTAVLAASTAALTAGQITSADQAQVINLADQAKTLIDSARQLEATDTTAASAKLTLANGVLTQLQAYLNSRKGT